MFFDTITYYTTTLQGKIKVSLPTDNRPNRKAYWQIWIIRCQISAELWINH